MLIGCLSLSAQPAGNTIRPVTINFQASTAAFIHNSDDLSLVGNMQGGATVFRDNVMEDILDVTKQGAGFLINNTSFNLSKVLTISCWIRAPRNRQRDRIIMLAGNENQPGNFSLMLSKITGHLQLLSPELTGDCGSGVTVDDNYWHHIAVTYKPGRLQFYKDGSLIKAAAVTGSIIQGNTGCSIGSLASLQNSFGGYISQVKIYSAILNSIKIREQYYQTQAIWNLSEGMGISSFERKGNLEYGMLNGAANTYDNYGVAHTGRIKASTWITDKKFGHALTFDKTNSGVYIDSAEQVQLKNRFTITCWVRAAPGSKKRRVIVSKGADTSALSYFELSLQPGTGELNFFTVFSGHIHSAVVVPDNRWHHIAIICSTGKLAFYKDGKIINTSVIKGAVAAATSTMTIGNRSQGGYPFLGNIAHLQIHGKTFTPDEVNNLYYALPTAYWKMDAVKGTQVEDVTGMHNGRAKNIRQVPGKGSSFSSVLNFETKNARIVVATAPLLSERFTIAAWVQVTANRSENKSILTKGKPGAPGSFQLLLQAGSGNLVFIAPGISGDKNSGFQVDDNQWHHIMVTYANGKLQFYKDRQLLKTSLVAGRLLSTPLTMQIGNAAGQPGNFGGSIAEVKIYNSVRTPEEVTSVVPPAGPALILKRGIVFDRIQNQGLPVKPEWEIGDNDIAVAKAIGFDHIKLLLTADEFIQNGSLNQANMPFVEKTVDQILASGLPCVIDLHPEGKFKARYVGTDTGLVQMFSFYKAFATYLAERWSPQQVAFQLMTEPFGNKPGDWNRISDEMVAAVRSVMPYHTLIVSGDRAGNIYAMTSMVPLNDPNIYYSFTTYEPYRFGFNTQFGAWRGAGSYWKDISYMPWPATPKIVQARMDAMLETVDAKDKSKAEKDLIEYGNGYFNSQWLNLRAKNVQEWNDAYGGGLQVMVTEFGAIDHKQAAKNGQSKGIYPQERVQFINDLRRSFESVGMGWEYWSFNEYFTILDPALRKPYGPASIAIADTAMIRALGL